jgi:hypothetical protein
MEPQAGQGRADAPESQARLAAWRRQQEALLTEERREIFEKMRRWEQQEQDLLTRYVGFRRHALITAEMRRLSQADPGRQTDGNTQERKAQARHNVEAHYQTARAAIARDGQIMRDAYLLSPTGARQDLETAYTREWPTGRLAPKPQSWQARQLAELTDEQRGRYDALHAGIRQRAEALDAAFTDDYEAILAADIRFIHFRGDLKFKGLSQAEATEYFLDRHQRHYRVMCHQLQLEAEARLDHFLHKAERERRQHEAQQAGPARAAQDDVGRALATIRQQEAEREASRGHDHGREG